MKIRYIIFALLMSAPNFYCQNDQDKKEISVQKEDYIVYVKECLDLLLDFGRDRYGKIHSPILVSILDAESRECPQMPLAPPTLTGR